MESSAKNFLNVFCSACCRLLPNFLLLVTALSHVHAHSGDHSLHVTEKLPVESASMWELQVSFDDVIRIQGARQLPGELRRASRPAPDSVLNMSYRAEWLDSKKRIIFSSPLEVALGERAPGEGKSGCKNILAAAGIATLRVPGPRGSAHAVSGIRIRGQGVEASKQSLYPRAARMAARGFQRTSFLRLRGTRQVAAAIGFNSQSGITALVESGAAHERLSLVIMGDGYQSNELGQFAADADRMVAELKSAKPWSDMMPLVNIYRIDAASSQSGADNPAAGESVDTYFNSSFWTNNIERLLAIDAQGAGRARALADSFLGPDGWDRIIVIVNTPKYGGSGGEFVVTSAHVDAGKIMLHELGHSFAGLADEYGGDGSARGYWASHANVDVDGVNPKWAAWLTPGVPLPTMLQPGLKSEEALSNVVGAFEGASHYDSGIYRPAHRCMMRDLGADFCPVCREAHHRALASNVQLVRAVKPTKAKPLKVSKKKSALLEVRAMPLFEESLSYRWSVCGTVVSSERNSSLKLTSKLLKVSKDRGGVCEVKLEVAYSTPHVRSYEIKQALRWQVKLASKARGN